MRSIRAFLSGCFSEAIMKNLNRAMSGLCAALMSLVIGCGGSIQQPPPVQPAAAAAPAPAGSNEAVNEINKAISLSAAQSSTSTHDYRIGPDDLIQVTIYNIPEQEARGTPRTVILRVSQQGMVVVPLVGEVNVKGKTVAQVQEELGKRYAKYIRNPQVGVIVTEYRQRVSVMGAVQKPGVFELTGPKTVIDMLALAGGVTDRAGNQVHVYRQD
jgi:polysaccharide export outer membrane protein